MQSWDLRKVSPYPTTGMSASISAARISYALGLKGASYIIDTACSSALVAIVNAATTRWSQEMPIPGPLLEFVTHGVHQAPSLANVLGCGKAFRTTRRRVARREHQRRCATRPSLPSTCWIMSGPLGRFLRRQLPLTLRGDECLGSPPAELSGDECLRDVSRQKGYHGHSAKVASLSSNNVDSTFLPGGSGVLAKQPQ